MENMEAVQDTQGVAVGKEQTTDEKTFTQSELDEILKKRLAREREKMNLIATGEFEQKLLARERAVMTKEFRAVARERLTEAGLPTVAAEFIDCTSEEAFESSYQKMAKMLGPMLEQAVETKVDERFRQVGHTPQKGGGHGADLIKDAVRTAFKK